MFFGKPSCLEISLNSLRYIAHFSFSSGGKRTSGSCAQSVSANLKNRSSRAAISTIFNSMLISLPRDSCLFGAPSRPEATRQRSSDACNVAATEAETARNHPDAGMRRRHNGSQNPCAEPACRRIRRPVLPISPQPSRQYTHPTNARIRIVAHRDRLVHQARVGPQAQYPRGHRQSHLPPSIHGAWRRVENDAANPASGLCRGHTAHSHPVERRFEPLRPRGLPVRGQWS